MKFRSVKSIVNAPAKTGMAIINKKLVIAIDQTNIGVRDKINEPERIPKIVVMKFKEAIIDEAPPRCKERIRNSPELPEWATLPDRGG